MMAVSTDGYWVVHFMSKGVFLCRTMLSDQSFLCRMSVVINSVD